MPGLRMAVRFRGIAILCRHIAPHQEGWRDWPEETPATPSDLGPRKVPTPAGVAARAWKMWEERSSRNLRPLKTRRRSFYVRGANGSRLSEMQGMRPELSARCPLRL